MAWRCPTCGQEYEALQAETQGFLCLQCGVTLTPEEEEQRLPQEEQPAFEAETPVARETEATSSALHCPSCHRTYAPEEAQTHGYLCPACQVPLQDQPAPRVYELRPGQEWPGQAGGRYRLEGVIGHGGQAQVWRARVLSPPPGRADFPQEVALKIYLGQPERFSAVLDIYAHLARQSIPYVTPLLDHGQAGPWTFLVFPFYPEGHVRPEHFRTPQGDVDWATLHRLVAHITDALAAIHGLRIVHRDVKPSNLFLDTGENTPRFVLGDFGMATLHSVSGFRGTLLYTPPEAFLWTFREGEEGEGAVLPAWDWWSLGVTLAELITGEHPFRFLEGQPWGALARYWEREFQRDELIASLQVPESWALVLRGLLTRNPELRWNHLQVRQWLRDPYSVPVPEEPRSLLVVSFRGQHFYSFHSLAWDAWEHWEQAKRHFIERGQWMELATRLPETRRQALQQWMFQRPRSEDAQLAFFLWVLAPDLPLGLGAQRSWPTLEALVQALAQGDDPLVQQLREQGLFSAYFALTRGQAYPALAKRWQAGWVPVLQAWEEDENLRPLLVALLLSPEYMEQVQQRLVNHIERFFERYLCAPEVAQELRQAMEEISQWDASRPELRRWEEVFRTVEQRPREASRQGMAVSRERARRMLEEARQQLQQLAEESLPTDETTQEIWQEARRLLGEMEEKCQQVNWACWERLVNEVHPLLQKVSTHQKSMLNRLAFEQRWKRYLTIAERICREYVPLGEKSRQRYQELCEVYQQAREIPATSETGLQRLELLSQLRKLLEDVQRLSRLSRTEVVQRLRTFQEHWGPRAHQIIWPPRDRTPYNDIRHEMDRWLRVKPQNLSNLQLADFETFWHRWHSIEDSLLLRGYWILWQLGLLAQVIMVGLAALVLPSMIDSVYPREDVATWQAWTWLMPLITLLFIGGTWLSMLPQSLRTSSRRHWMLLGLYIWTIIAWWAWVVWYLWTTENLSLEQAIILNLTVEIWGAPVWAFPLLYILIANYDTEFPAPVTRFCSACGCLLVCMPLGALLALLPAWWYYPIGIGWGMWLLVITFPIFETLLKMPYWWVVFLLSTLNVLLVPVVPYDLFYIREAQT